MDLIKIRQNLHKIPEEGFKEFKTQKYILEVLKSFPQERLEFDTWKTGVLVKIMGKNPKKTIGFRTDMDGLPLKEKTGLPFASVHDGWMHACGHDIHMTIALGIVDYFTHQQIDDNIVVIFQPAEEGPGGALPMMNSEVFKRYKPDLLLALHVAPELPVGVVSTKTGSLFAHCSDIKIKFKGESAHGARPHLGNDMVVAASHFVTQIQSIVSRNMDPLECNVVSIGKLISGQRTNIVSDVSIIEGTIRSFKNENMEKIKKRIKETAEGICKSFDCEAEVTFENDYYGVVNHKEKTKDFMKFVNEKTKYTFVEAQKTMAAEDFGYFLKEIPGFMFWLGVDSEKGLHTSQLNPKEEAIEIANQLIIKYIEWL